MSFRCLLHELNEVMANRAQGEGAAWSYLMHVRADSVGVGLGYGSSRLP